MCNIVRHGVYIFNYSALCQLKRTSGFRDSFSKHQEIEKVNQRYTVTVNTLSTHVPKPLLNLNVCAQSNWQRRTLYTSKREEVENIESPILGSRDQFCWVFGCLGIFRPASIRFGVAVPW